MIRTHTIGLITTTGEDGSATGSGVTTAPINGRVLAAYLDYSANQAVTTDVTIATKHAPVRTILTVTDNKTDAWYNPRHAVQDETGADVTYDGTHKVCEPVAVSDYISVAVAQGNNGETVTATLIVEER